MRTSRAFCATSDERFDGRNLLSLDATDVDLLRVSVRTVLEQIDEPEFHTRLGETVQTARRVLADLGAVVPSRTTPGGTDIDLTIDDLRFVKQSLNEILNGLGVTEVIDRFSAERISSLLSSFGAHLQKEQHVQRMAVAERSTP